MEAQPFQWPDDPILADGARDPLAGPDADRDGRLRPGTTLGGPGGGNPAGGRGLDPAG